MKQEFVKIVNYSLSKNTWSSYSSGWASFRKFEISVKQNFSLPLNIETVRTYVIWCVSVQKLRASTVKLYLSSMKMAHTLQGFQCISFLKDSIIDMLLTGIVNKEPCVPKIRRAMTLDILLILGHKIANSDWHKISKQVVWAVCTVGFFTSVRMGEILAAQTDKFDSYSTLTWENVVFLDRDEALLYIPSTKTSTRGDFLDLFPLNGHPCCPVAALKKLKDMQVEGGGGFSKNRPVFTFASGKFLTTANLNNLLKLLLKDILGEGVDAISCHSFRAALASAVCAHPDRFRVSEIQEWSKWRGSSFLTYCRSYRDQRRALFKKIVSVLK
jgi:hypothetical protein